jgi:PAS domain S-box-containing protein
MTQESPFFHWNGSMFEQWQVEWAIASRLAGLGVAEWDLQTQRIRWSPELEAIYGLAVGTFGGERWQFEERVHPEDRAEVMETIDRAIESHGGFELEFEIVKTGGQVAFVKSVGRVIQRQGQMKLMEAVRLRDEEVSVNQGLVEQERQWQRRLAIARDVLFRLLPSGSILWVAEAVYRAFGYAPEGLVGQSLLLKVHPAEQAQVVAALRQASRFGAMFSLTFHYWHHAGRWVAVEGYGGRLAEEGEELVFYLRTVVVVGEQERDIEP